jgi:hypothetical protein
MKNNIYIESTLSSPEVNFNFATNKLTITGVCTPENPKLFFDPIINAFEEYQKLYNEVTIDIYLDYFNTGTSKCLLNMLFKSAGMELEKTNTIVNWMVDNEDSELLESGQMLEEISKLKFNYVFVN